MKPLYTNIRALREARGWTQDDLAAKMGYKDRSMIAKIEAGKVDITVSKVELFADLFGIAPVDLIGWRDSGECTALCAIYDSVNAEGQAALRAVAAGIAATPAYSKKNNTAAREA